MGAQVVGISTDHPNALAAWQKQHSTTHRLLSDFGPRSMIRAYGAMQTDEKSPVYRHARRAYFIVDKNGIVKFAKVMESNLTLLDPAEILAATKAAL